MTRFARAKGSKSDNARVEEEATEWSEFKQQIDEKNAKRSIETTSKTTVTTAQSKIERIRECSYTVIADWADFGSPQRQNFAAEVSQNKRSHTDVEEEVQTLKKKVKQSVKVDSFIKNEKCIVSQTHEHDENNGKRQLEEDQSNYRNVKVRKEDRFATKVAKPQSKPHISGHTSVKNNIKGEDFKKWRPNQDLSTINTNGTSLSVSNFEGYAVKTEDATRLQELKSRMFREGIPKAEIYEAMKLERRRAEKALARAKNKVCFNCREPGHVLAECPNVGSSFGSKQPENLAVDMCYKCGSAEHTHHQCQVKKKNEYGFATCFICKEHGHIASQCPDNPKGLYPQGGSCRICGEVTHLKKFCPKLTKEKSKNIFTLDVMSSDNYLESLDHNFEAPRVKKLPVKKQKKVIKF